MADVFMDNKAPNYRPKAVRRSNITATSMGVAFHKFMPLISSCYKYPNARVKGIALSVASQMKRGVTDVNVAGSCAIVHSQWSRGYYHWLTESVPRAIVAKEFDPRCRILLPRSHSSFHPASLDLLNYEHVPFEGHNVSIPDAVVTSCPKTYASTHPELLRDVRRRLRRATSCGTDMGRRLYISRRISRGRKITNEAEVSSLLEGLGFLCIAPEEFTFSEQVSIFSKADFIVGIHGAGLTNMLFMKPGAAVVEILPFRNGMFDFRPNSFSLKHDHCYRTLAEAMGHKHFYLQCKHNKSWYQRTNLADLTVDCTNLKSLVAHICGRADE